MYVQHALMNILSIWIITKRNNFHSFDWLNYCGLQCEYQNQQVRLPIRSKAFFDSRQRSFEILIQPVANSNGRILHSYVELTFLFARDCQLISYCYLLYY